MNNSNTYNDFFANKRVLITGGAGFIGSHLVNRLIELGCFVNIIDDLSSGTKERINGKNINFIKGNILDYEDLSRAIQDCSIIFHLAAFVSAPKSVNNPEECFEINVNGTKQVVTIAHEFKSKRIIFASSAACRASVAAASAALARASFSFCNNQGTAAPRC